MPDEESLALNARTKACVFLEEPPTFYEKGNVFHAIYTSGEAVFSVAFTPHTFLVGMAAARKAYDDWDAARRGTCNLGAGPIQIEGSAV